MRNMLKLGFSLFLFSVVAALALAGTNAITKSPIERQLLEASQAAQRAVLTDAEIFEDATLEKTDSTYSEIDEVFIGKKGDDTVGYVLTASPRGYGGDIPITLGVSVDGSVHGVSVGSLSETAGLGTRVAEEPFMNQFIGIAADPDTLSNDVSTISGATVSSAAFVTAVNQMLDYSKNVLGVEPHEGKRVETAAVETAQNEYAVNGFGPMVVAVDVDADGKVTAVSVVSHNETPGYGADLIANQSIFEALVGQDIASAQIDVVSSVTLTSNAINSALVQAGQKLGYIEVVGEEPASIDNTVYEVKGFQPMTVDINVDEAGKIKSVSVPVHNETPDYGADLIANSEIFDALIGQDIATAQIDVVAGVTMTSGAINDALQQAAAAFAAPTAEGVAEPALTQVATEPEAAAITGTAYEVQGFQPMTVAIDVDEAGKIKSVSVPVHNETAGYGADLIANSEIFDALVGQDITTAQIDVVAGVTMTSGAINDALQQAAEAVAAPVSAEVVTPAATAEEVVEPALTQVATEPEAAAITGTAYEVQGFQPMTVVIDVDEAAKIKSVSVLAHNETAGFGADLIANNEIFDALVGQDIATAQIDVVASVTMTSDAINDALKQAAEAVAAPVSAKVVTPAAAPTAEEVVEPALTQVATEPEATVITGTAYEVQGFQPMTVVIDVDEAAKIKSVSVLAHNETAGFGADLIDNSEIFDALAGQDIATAQIDVVASVTMTSDAINDALKQAAAAIAAPAAEEAAEPASVLVAEPIAYTVSGYSSQDFDVLVALDSEGKIVSIEVPSHSETPSIGGKVIDSSSIFDALVGTDIETAQIDVVTHATFTCDAINDALRQAANAFMDAKEVQ